MTIEQEIIIKAFLVEDMDNIKEINVRVTDLRCVIVKEKLKLEAGKIFNILKELKKAGVIKSIFIPKNRRLKKELDKLVHVKKQIKNSIDKINTLFN